MSCLRFKCTWIRIKFLNICQEKCPIIQNFFLTEEQRFIFNPLPQISFIPRRLRDPSTVRVCFPVSIKGDMLIRKYKEIVECLCIHPKTEVIVGCLIEKNDHYKDKNLIGLPIKRRKKDVSKKKQSKEKLREKLKRKISEPFSVLQKNKEMAKMSTFKRMCQLISSR